MPAKKTNSITDVDHSKTKCHCGNLLNAQGLCTCGKSQGECHCKNMYTIQASEKSKLKNYGLLTRERVIARLKQVFRDSNPTQLLAQCERDGLIKNAGGASYLTKYSLDGIVEHLQATNPIQVAIGHSTIKQNNLLKQIQANDMDNSSNRTTRIASLTEETLRTNPSYSFCLHPALKQQILEGQRRVQTAVAQGLIDTCTANIWYSELENVRTGMECDKALSKVHSYLNGFQTKYANVEQELNKLRNTESLFKLREYLKSPDVLLRREAIKMLAQHPDGVELIRTMVDDENEYVQESAVEAIGTIESIQALRELLDHPSEIVRARSLRELQKIRQKYSA